MHCSFMLCKPSMSSKLCKLMLINMKVFIISIFVTVITATLTTTKKLHLYLSHAKSDESDESRDAISSLRYFFSLFLVTSSCSVL